MPQKHDISFTGQIPMEKWSSITWHVISAFSHFSERLPIGEFLEVRLKQASPLQFKNDIKLNVRTARHVVHGGETEGKYLFFRSENGRRIRITRTGVEAGDGTSSLTIGEEDRIFDFLVRVTMVLIDTMVPGILVIESDKSTQKWREAEQFVQQNVMHDACIPKALTCSDTDPRTQTARTMTAPSIFKDRGGSLLAEDLYF